MDDIVKQAMAKWPNVPDCYGWLALDARGNWYMRDEAAQSCATFQVACSGRGGAAGKGSRLQHLKLIEFIGRNYQSDAEGRWYFQNGPQRVYVELELAPWVFRVNPDCTVETHTGVRVDVVDAITDENGHLYLRSNLGLGLVHTQDVQIAADILEDRTWSLRMMEVKHLPEVFGFVVSPQAAPSRCKDMR
ncbi:MAG: DUF2946 family protein [Burkholderiales bacterium]|nr:DUF2946 family protein [Burkholderiales bacterium]